MEEGKIGGEMGTGGRREKWVGSRSSKRAGEHIKGDKVWRLEEKVQEVVEQGTGRVGGLILTPCSFPLPHNLQTLT